MPKACHPFRNHREYVTLLAPAFHAPVLQASVIQASKPTILNDIPVLKPVLHDDMYDGDLLYFACHLRSFCPADHL